MQENGGSFLKIGGYIRRKHDFYGKLGVSGVSIQKSGVWWENRGFSGKWWFLWKMLVFSENRVFVGFWSIIRGKVGKSREFDHFLKIGKNREK